MTQPASRTRPGKPAFRARAIQKSSISDVIVRQIMEQIASGNLKPGQRLPSERELCKSFHAGRSSLREALRCLSIVGVLTARVGEGTSVAADGSRFLGTMMRWRFDTGSDSANNLLEMLVALEALTAESSAGRASEEETGALTTLLEQMQAVENDARRFGSLDLEFHRIIAKASQNQLLYDLVLLIRRQLAAAFSEELALPDTLPLSIDEHAQIVQAIRQRSPGDARKAMQTHLEAVIARTAASTDS